MIIGEKVKIKGTNIYGKIQDITDNTAVVISNEKKIITNINNLEKNDRDIGEKDADITVKVKVISKAEDTIMIRHQTVEEALLNVDKFIDNAICNNVRIVKIIHGKRGGKLRKAVHNYLEHNENVKEHRLGGYYEGGYGVTIVFLK